MTEAIRLNDHGEVVLVHQRHLNDRLRAHGSQPLDVTGTCDSNTVKRSAFAAWFLGALDSTVEDVQAGTIAVGVQGIIADPDSREDAQRARARDRRGRPFSAADGSSANFKIVGCSGWGAVAPTHSIARVGRPNKIIFHHTFGHHPELDNRPGDNLKEAAAYARSIQREHMHRTPTPFIDSGHNFLVTRSGHILEGRHGSLAAIKDGVMVRSAHCIGENDQPGIEHEHRDEPTMTPIQREASLFLHELICRKTGIKPTAIHPHKQFDNTACPAELLSGLAKFRHDLAKRLAT
jgi:hypothetical protein